MIKNMTPYYFLDNKILALCNSIMEAEATPSSSSSSSATPSASSSTAPTSSGLTELPVQCPDYPRGSQKFSRRKSPPQYIIIHYTAGTTSAPGAAARTAKWLNGQSNQASADFFVDQKNIIQLNPDYHKFYSHSVRRQSQGNPKNGVSNSVNGKCYNGIALGIEVCSDFDKAKDDGKRWKNQPSAENTGYSMNPQTVALAAKLCGALMKEFNIDASHVVMHNMVDGKLCPAPWSRTSEDVKEFEKFVQMASENQNYSVPKSPVEIGNESFDSGAPGGENDSTYNDETDDVDEVMPFSNDNTIIGRKMNEFLKMYPELALSGSNDANSSFAGSASATAVKAINGVVTNMGDSYPNEVKTDFKIVADEYLMSLE